MVRAVDAEHDSRVGRARIHRAIPEVEAAEEVVAENEARRSFRIAVQVATQAAGIGEVVVVKAHVARTIAALGRAEKAEERASTAHGYVVIELGLTLTAQNLQTSVLI